MHIYSVEDYIILSKLITRNVEEKKSNSQLIKLFLESLTANKNILLQSNYIWVVKNTLHADLRISLLQDNIKKLKNEAEKEYKLCIENNIHILTYEDEKFPKRLKQLLNPPITIYYQGYFPSDDLLKDATAVVGSRNIYDKYGGKLAYKIGENLAKKKKWNISGLALGIDTYGHKGSLNRGGYTGAFIAQGLLIDIYPKENLPLKFEIIRKGGFIATEFPVFTRITREKFILRNRLQVGLVDYVIVPEFNEKGGTISTIEFGIQKGIPVYICSPKKTLEKDPDYNIYNKGNAILSFDEKTLKEIYPDFVSSNYQRLYKIKKDGKYKIVERIPKFSTETKIVIQKKLF